MLILRFIYYETFFTFGLAKIKLKLIKYSLMKIKTIKTLALITTALMLIFSSCVDEKVKLDNLSTDVKIGGNLAAPIGEITVSMQELLDSLEIDSVDNFSIGEDNGVLAIYFSDTLSYDNPAEIDLSEFGTIDEQIDFGGTNGFAPDSTFPFIVPDGINARYPVVRGYNFDEINDDPSKQRIDSIRFTNTTINVEVTSSINLPAGFASIDIQLPGEFLELDTTEVIKMPLLSTTSTKSFAYENFVVNSIGKDTTDFDIDLVVTGNSSVTINSTDWIKIEITLTNTNFVAHGYFNLGADLLQKDESLDIDIFSELPDETTIYPHNPEINFKVNSNIGIPLLFNLKSLTAYENATDSVKANFNGSPSKTFSINAAPSYGETATSNITLNRDIDKGETNKLFTIQADSISTKFSFGIKDTLTPPSQFASSDSKVEIVMESKIPFWLDEGSNISLTLDTIDLDEKLIDDIFADDNIKEVYIYIKATNKLPMGVSLNVNLLDVDSALITTANPYVYEIKAGAVDAFGAVLNPTETIIKIKYTKENFNELLTAEYLAMRITAQGYDINSKMKFTTQDWLKLKLSVYGIGEYIPEEDDDNN